MCREEALKVWQLKPQLEARNCQLVCLLVENIPAEVEEFRAKFWPGDIYLDNNLAFFSAVGGGKPRSMGIMSLLNPFSKAMKNYSRSKKTVSESNFTGNGLTGGGFIVVATGGQRAEYAFQEKNFGDHAPVEDILSAVERLSHSEGR
jgi:hypothetical protein